MFNDFHRFLRERLPANFGFVPKSFVVKALKFRLQ